MRGRGWAAAAAAAAGVALAVVVGRAWDEAGRGGLDRAAAELRAAGFETSAARWNAAAEGDDNGAPRLDAADAALVRAQGDVDAWAAGPLRLTQATDAAPAVDEVVAFRAAVRPYLAEVDAALRSARVRWPLAGEGADDEGRSPGQTVFRLLRVSHAVAAHGNASAALASVERRLLLARRAEGYAAGVATYLVVAVTQAVSDLRDVVEEGRVPAADARRRLDALLRDTRMAARLPDIARAELVVHHALLRAKADGRAELATLPSWSRPHERLANVVRGGPGDVLRTLADVARVGSSSHAERQRLYAAIEADASRAAFWHGMVFRQLDQSHSAADQATALARVALAVRAHREATGAWPPSLDALRGEFEGGVVPVDPVTEAPFEYELAADEVRVGIHWKFPR